MVETTERRSPKIEVWVFFGAVIILNAIFVMAIAEDWLPSSLFSLGRFFVLGGVLAVVVFLFRGFGAVLDLVRPLFVWRLNPLWFVVAFLWPIVFSILFVTGKAFVTGSELVLFSEAASLLTNRRILLTIFIAALIGEIVWVGYAIRTLGQSHSRFFAAVVTGSVWGLWWLPMSYYQIGIVPGLSLFGLWINMVGIAFFCTFFYALTKSGLVIFVMQFCFNCSVLAFPVLPRSGGIGTHEVYSTIYMIVGIIFVMVWLPRIEARRAAQAPAVS